MAERASRNGRQRNIELEAAIIAEPDDPVARMVYRDWLQSVGDPLGEWAALATAIEAEPDNIELRAARVGYLDDHQRDVLGEGAAILRGGWLGWRGGFVDEIRLQAPVRSIAKKTAALLAHPSCRFVRHIAIGPFPDVHAIVDAVIAAAPPLLESLLVGDDSGPWWKPVKQPINRIAKIGTLRRLALRGYHVGAALRQLDELSIATPLLRSSPAIQWLLERGAPDLEELLIDCVNSHSAGDVIAEILAMLPKLRRLRLLHLRKADEVVDAITPHMQRLELVDLSHSDLSTHGAERLGGKLVAIRADPARPDNIYDLVDEGGRGSWLSHRLDVEGRDALRLVPGAGRMLFNLSVHHEEERALQLLAASLTLPDAAIGTYAYANAAGALERLHRFVEAELVAREGLLRSPLEPNLFSFLIDALRRSQRLDIALRLVPRALATLTRDNTDPMPHKGKTREACLNDCLFTLAQAGQHAKVIATAKMHEKLVDPKAHGIVAMSQLALGNRRAARTALAKASADVVVHHAQAAMFAATGERARAIAQLKKARAKNYPEWHWIAVDPNLASLRELPSFLALQSS